MSLETILVALILIVEVIDVARHWYTHAPTEITYTFDTTDCSRCLSYLASSVRRQSGIRFDTNSNTSPEEDSGSSTADHNPDAHSAHLDSDADTARAFLNNPHRHVSQPVKYSRDSMRHHAHG